MTPEALSPGQLGAHVTAVTSAENVKLVRSIGADEIIDYTKEDFVARGQLYDVLFDLGGNRSLSECRRVVKANGTFLMVGAPVGLGKLLARIVGVVYAEPRSRFRRPHGQSPRGLYAAPPSRRLVA